jgi:hypothetical protein
MRNIMSNNEAETLTPKGEALVKHCPICGVEFDDGVAYTNRWLLCGSCDTEFMVKVREKSQG